MELFLPLSYRWSMHHTQLLFTAEYFHLQRGYHPCTSKVEMDEWISGNFTYCKDGTASSNPRANLGSEASKNKFRSDYKSSCFGFTLAPGLIWVLSAIAVGRNNPESATSRSPRSNKHESVSSSDCALIYPVPFIRTDSDRLCKHYWITSIEEPGFSHIHFSTRLFLTSVALFSLLSKGSSNGLQVCSPEFPQHVLFLIAWCLEKPPLTPGLIEPWKSLPPRFSMPQWGLFMERKIRLVFHLLNRQGTLHPRLKCSSV